MKRLEGAISYHLIVSPNLELVSSVPWNLLNSAPQNDRIFYIAFPKSVAIFWLQSKHVKAELDQTSIAELMLRSASDSRCILRLLVMSVIPWYYVGKLVLQSGLAIRKLCHVSFFLPAYVTSPLKPRRSLYSTRDNTPIRQIWKHPQHLDKPRMIRLQTGDHLMGIW